MKKKVLTIITLFVVIVWLFILAKTSNNSARILPIEQDEIKVAYTWAFKNLITSKSSIEDANVNWDITRVEMAKMISNFSKTILQKNVNLKM